METNRERKHRLKLSQAKCWKERQRSKAFMLIVPLIGAFYGILAVQYVLEYDTSIEKCYKNYGCARNGFHTDLNHLVSNIGFLLYGVFFVLITAYKYKKVGNQFIDIMKAPEENGDANQPLESGDAVNGVDNRVEGSLTQLPDAETTYGIVQQYRDIFKPRKQKKRLCL